MAALVSSLCKRPQLGLPLNQTEDAALITATNDGVRFPVAEATLAGHDRRPLLDIGAIGDLAPTNIATVTFAPLFYH